MKRFILQAVLLTAFNVSAGWVHPMDYDGSQKAEVVQYIKDLVAERGGSAVLARVYERAELKAFKQLTKFTDRELMDRLASRKRGYSILWVYYRAEKQAASEELTW